MIGCNFEDQLTGSEGLHDPAERAARIAAVDQAGLFVNARADIFLGPLLAGEDPNRKELVDRAVARAAIYDEAGAGCFFIPGLSAPDFIERVCKDVSLPVNVMRLPGMSSSAKLAKMGVARISYGPGPWRAAMDGLERAASAAQTI